MAEQEDREEREVGAQLERLAARAGTVAAGIGGSVAFIYLIGGGVMWLRFDQAGLPPDTAVALVPNSDLLVVGLRVMVLPVVAAGALFLLLGLRERRKRARGERPLWRRRGALAAACALVLLLALTVPLTVGGMAWPVGLGVLLAYWRRQSAAFPESASARGYPVLRLAGAAVLAAATISVARQLDVPVALPSATVTEAGHSVTGALVASTDSLVAIGLPETQKVQVFSRDKLTSVTYGPPFDAREPSRSLLARVFGGDFSLTPIEVWCKGQRYPWSRVQDACRTQPSIVLPPPPLGPPPILASTLPHGKPQASVRLRCPEAAFRACVGYVTLHTVRPFVVSRFAPARSIPFGAVPFTVPAGRVREVCIGVGADIRGTLALASPVPMRVIVSSDAAGEAVQTEREVSYEVPLAGQPPRQPQPTDCLTPKPSR